MDASEELSSFDMHDRDIFKGKKKLSRSFQTVDNKEELKIPRFNTQRKQIRNRSDVARKGAAGTLAGSSQHVWATQGCQKDKSKHLSVFFHEELAFNFLSED